MEHEHSIEIDAPAPEVWKVLVDVTSWPSWTESMTSVERLDQGRFALGSKAKIKQPGLPTATWEVTSFEPGKAFVWESRTPALQSVGSHRVVPKGKSCTVHLRFATSGPLAGFFALFTSRLVRKYVGMEAAGLKRRAEAG